MDRRNSFGTSPQFIIVLGVIGASISILSGLSLVGRVRWVDVVLLLAAGFAAGALLVSAVLRSNAAKEARGEDDGVKTNPQ